MIELQELIDQSTIMCLTETQQKVDKLNLRMDIEKYVSMRKIESKKGGGLMILKQKESQIVIEDFFTIHEDCMGVECRMHGFKFVIINVYYRSNDCNVELNRKVGDYVQENEELPLIVVGDFDAHIGLIGEPYNRNGRLMMEMVEKNNLTILNGTPECEGKITWEARGQKSVIDYA